MSQSNTGTSPLRMAGSDDGRTILTTMGESHKWRTRFEHGTAPATARGPRQAPRGKSSPAAAAARGHQPLPAHGILSADQLEAIHATSLRILEELGMEVMSTRALELLARGGRRGRRGDPQCPPRPWPRRGHVEPRAAVLRSHPAQRGQTRHPRRQITSISGSSRVRPTCMITSAAAGPGNLRITATSSASRTTSTRFICSATRSARRSSCRRIRAISTPIAPTSCIPIWSSTARPSAPDVRSTACG